MEKRDRSPNKNIPTNLTINMDESSSNDGSNIDVGKTRQEQRHVAMSPNVTQ